MRPAKLLGLLALCAFLGCGAGGRQPLNTGQPVGSCNTGLPEWVRLGADAFPKDRGKVLYGIGSLRGVKDEALGQIGAFSRAKAELLKQVKIIAAASARRLRYSMGIAAEEGAQVVRFQWADVCAAVEDSFEMRAVHSGCAEGAHDCFVLLALPVESVKPTIERVVLAWLTANRRAGPSAEDVARELDEVLELARQGRDPLAQPSRATGAASPTAGRGEGQE